VASKEAIPEEAAQLENTTGQDDVFEASLVMLKTDWDDVFGQSKYATLAEAKIHVRNSIAETLTEKNVEFTQLPEEVANRLVERALVARLVRRELDSWGILEHEPDPEAPWAQPDLAPVRAVIDPAWWILTDPEIDIGDTGTFHEILWDNNQIVRIRIVQGASRHTMSMERVVLEWDQLTKVFGGGPDSERKARAEAAKTRGRPQKYNRNLVIGAIIHFANHHKISSRNELEKFLGAYLAEVTPHQPDPRTVERIVGEWWTHFLAAEEFVKRQKYD
jgi:hypothetical protein